MTMTKDSLAANDLDDMNYQTFRHDTPASLENGVSLAYSFQYLLLSRKWLYKVHDQFMIRDKKNLSGIKFQ